MMAAEQPKVRGGRGVVRRIILIFAALACIAALFWFFLLPVLEEYTLERTSNHEYVDLRKHLGLSGAGEDMAAVFLGSEQLAERALVRDGTVYWDADSVRKYFADNFWYSLSEGVLLLTTADEVVRVEAGALSFTRHAEAVPAAGVTPKTVTTEAPVFLIEEGVPWIALGYVHEFSNFTYALFTEPYRVRIDIASATVDAASVLKGTALRDAEGRQGAIVSELEQDEIVFVLNQTDDWSAVMAQDALTGYVENRCLSTLSSKAIELPETYVPPPYTALTAAEKLCLAWHQVSVYDANAYLEDLISEALPLDVVSPTWYSIADGSGAVASLASADYVSRAHAHGLKVWPLVDDFTSGLDRETLLGSTQSRNTFVSYMLGQAKELGFDGINLDFEVVPEEAAWGFEQLLRELSVACRAHGLVFSIDNYPPRERTEHYNRRLQGEIADYVIIMGYDEHWGSSSGAGSVASLPFVEDAIQRTLEVVPAEKVINAVPFYTRIWSTARDGTVKVERTIGQKSQDAWIEAHGLETIWSEELGQDYTQTDADGKLWQVWLENERSMRTRVEMMERYALGGVAGWRLGLENPAYWAILGDYVRR